MISLVLGLTLLHPPDSQATLRAARRAQAEFESFRRYHLPEASDYAGQPCDLHIGRYCFWYGDQTNDSVPEPTAIRDARTRLLARLGDATAILPGDDWIAGQRVRYLIESGQRADAVAVGAQCRATAWWCAALVGFALHAAGDFAQADSAFTAALGAMPEEERCRWHDVSLLLPRDLRARYDHMSCDARAEFDARWWWLAAPLLSRPGNDRRTEHFARLTLAHIERDSHTTRDDAWADDARELLIRFGPEVSWTRRPSLYLTASDPVITGHERVPAFHFVPASHAFDDPGAARPEDWGLYDRRPDEWYAPAYADRFARLEGQWAAFRRGDSCTFVAAFDASRDPTLGHQAARAALVLARNERSLVISARETHLDGPEVLTAISGCDRQLASLEIVPATARWVARTRRGIEPPGPGDVSDLLVLDATDSRAHDLASVLPHVLPGEQVPVGGHLRLFWEVSGLAPAGEPVTTSLSVTAQGRAWLGRAAESIGLVGRRRAVELQWDEVLQPEGGVAPRVLDVDLSGLAAGRYRVTLAVSIGGGVPVTATREIELVRR